MPQLPAVQVEALPQLAAAAVQTGVDEEILEAQQPPPEQLLFAQHGAPGAPHLRHIRIADEVA